MDWQDLCMEWGMGREESGSMVNGFGKGVVIEEGQSSEGSINYKNVALAMDWRKLFSTVVDQTLNYYPPKRTERKLIVPSEVIKE